MRKSKAPVSPTMSVIGPENLTRPPSTNVSRNFEEDTLVYGKDDAQPLIIAKLVDQSPTATACLDVVAKFIKGESFTNKDLMNLRINREGQTLWDLHCKIVDTMTLFEGYGVNFKYSQVGKIISAYCMPFQSLRLVKPPRDEDTEIKFIKYNPFFGTAVYDQRFTKTYPVYNITTVITEALDERWQRDGKNLYPGQIYYYGRTTPLHLYYPIPRYWSGEHWIKVDAGIQEFHSQNIDNGFFQSVLINMIGDPSAKSRNPKYQKNVTGTDGKIRKEGTKTIAEEFNADMSENFAGKKRTGNAMVLWSQNKDTTAQVTAFPSNINADVFGGTLRDAIRGITIATGTPAILANLPQQESSLGSDGKSMKAAIELMQSRVSEQQTNLEQFYNEILLPNLAVEGYVFTEETKVKIQNFVPITQEVTIEDKFWDVLTDQEKRDFIRDNMPNIKLTEVAPGQVEPGQVNENLKNLTGMQMVNIQRIVRKFNKEQLTFEQAKDMLMSGFGFTEEQVNTWLITPEEDDDNTGNIIPQ